ncbi:MULTISPECIES: GGDEF domain-containing protein [Actinoalloteichus]|uniref:Diguanylate cyclase (GGDEF) domain-containing protein n=1 Tax=Actinoalloteichus fjordicus TaxID=1612552 RepID=A0AAC9PSL6_9PSEU|nr:MULTISPECIES: GGDEF domain-containing protein [Actinoalloteichus]APU15263.1 diguanylate cyclase (GGDEF) domain-containing protein [Actinoalloteichus fjordicus]APU21308.1 diguanylate cyclase (GGDEF) domain-containing protein [Actinoalloteichus sp. GBA129-24]
MTAVEARNSRDTPPDDPLAAAHAREAALEAEVHRLSRDDLTGFLRRGPWGQQAAEALLHLGSDALLLITDLDRFKRINDRFGHRGGDVVLRTQAHRLRESLPSTAVLGRLGGDGGDEFLALTERDAVDLQNLVQVLARPVEILGRAVPVSASVGAAVRPACAPAPLLADLLATADDALYEAKTAGRGSCRIRTC